MNFKLKPYGNRKRLVSPLSATFLGIPLLLFASTASVARSSGPPTTSAASNAHIYDVCITSFFFTQESSVGRSVTAWAPVPNPDLRKTIASFKTIAAISGFDVGNEDYRGSEATVTLFIKTAESAQKFPLRVEVDQALGTISMAGRANPDQDIPAVQAKELMCHMIAFAAGVPPPDASSSSSKSPARGLFRRPAKKSPQEENTRIHLAELDALHQRALSGGKTIVIIPSVNLKEKYATADDIRSRQTELLIDKTSTTIWQDKSDPRNVIKVGADATADNVGLHGYTYAFVAGKTRYFVYIVDPGTYTITGSTYEAMHASMPQPTSTRKKSSAPRLGQVSLAQVKSTEFYQTQAWFDAVYEDREIRDNYCSLTIAGGPCVQWNSSSHTVQDQIHGGGFREVTKSRAVDGLVVAAKLSKPFASFSVSPGEVVMVDGFFAEYPNVKFDEDRCEQVSGVNVQCDMKQYTLLRIPSQIDDLKALDENPISHKLPILRNILRDAKYRPATVSATPDKSGSSFGKRYTANDQ